MTERLKTPRILERCPMFSHLTPGDRERVAAIGWVRDFRRGEMLFTEADKAEQFYVVLDGDVKVFKTSASGKEQILHFARPFQTFAEAAVMMGGMFPASAMAARDARVFEIPRAQFLELVRGDPDFAVRVMASVARWLRTLVDLVEDLSFAEVPGRLARRIVKTARESGIELVDGAEIDLPMSKTDLARMLGTVSETLSRVFAKMSEDGLIEVRGRCIVVRSAERLGEIAVR
ncbi:MAG: Crp/Fnr family transcriptional regulator [Deltaproteobacteria bacterium]|nr:Crp/Fnr family transcriptional regulator [Deltaproteobacteria bacterium]